MQITPLTDELAHLCETQFAKTGYSKGAGYFKDALKNQSAQELAFFVAHEPDCYLGHVRLLWNSQYPPFKNNGIPEISDLSVVPTARNQGIGTMLIKCCEELAVTRSSKIGIGVGLYPDYNNAQRLYSRLGYVLDGCGVHYKNEPVLYGQCPPFDDDLIIHFTKDLSHDAAHPIRSVRYAG